MKLRYFIIYCLFFALLGITICCLILKFNKENSQEAYTTEINRLLIYLEDNWNSVSINDNVYEESSEPFEYAVIDMDDRPVLYTDDKVAKSISAATTHFDIIRDIEIDDRVVGRLIVHNDYGESIKNNNNKMIMLVACGFCLMLAISVLYFVFLNKRIVSPFKKLKSFSVRIAGGDLDTPLEMDKGHIFGEFTESFDIMRDELKAARFREEAAVKSRKELVAELSHDIKTPVASIKAMAEVLSLSASDTMEKETLESINKKADQIDNLISNLFHATLEELEQLEVKPEEASSTSIIQMINEADYQKKVEKKEILDAIVLYDELRLNQVISNIISNSYKYADTSIDISSHFEKDINDNDRYLIIDISDRGGGVPEEEIDTVTEKFRRGSNSEGKNGSGLGLYISKYLMEKMDGGLECRNNPEGFTVSIRLKLL